MKDASPSIDVSVIVPTFRDWEGLQGCLDALAAQSFDAGRFEILVASNNPTAEVPASLRLPGNARLVWQPKPGSYAARNAALAEARGGVLFFTDSDCRPEPDWIAAGLRRLAADPSVSRIAGRVVITPAGERWTPAEIYDRIFGLQQERYAGLGYAATANLVARRALFDAVGPFDESLYSSGDKEWNTRATAAGERIVFADEVRVRHQARGSYAEHARKRARVVGGKFAMQGRRRKLSYRFPVKFLLPSASAFLRVWRESGLTATERLRVYGIHYRLRLVEFRTRLALAYTSGPLQRQ
jgi:glycosyltransferase involved in cell wall biosynthesis